MLITWCVTTWQWKLLVFVSGCHPSAARNSNRLWSCRVFLEAPAARTRGCGGCWCDAPWTGIWSGYDRGFRSESFWCFSPPLIDALVPRVHALCYVVWGVWARSCTATDSCRGCRHGFGCGSESGVCEPEDYDEAPRHRLSLSDPKEAWPLAAYYLVLNKINAQRQKFKQKGLCSTVVFHLRNEGWKCPFSKWSRVLPTPTKNSSANTENACLGYILNDHTANKVSLTKNLNTLLLVAIKVMASLRRIVKLLFYFQNF